MNVDVGQDSGVKSCQRIVNGELTNITAAVIIGDLKNSRYGELRKFDNALATAGRDGIIYANNTELAQQAMASDLAHLPRYVGACAAHGVTLNPNKPLVR